MADSTNVNLVFRGLMAFVFEKDPDPNTKGHQGRLFVLMLDDADSLSGQKDLHRHEPRVEWYATRGAKAERPGGIANGINGKYVRLGFASAASTGAETTKEKKGVDVGSSFLNHVPCFSRLAQVHPRKKGEALVSPDFGNLKTHLQSGANRKMEELTKKKVVAVVEVPYGKLVGSAMVRTPAVMQGGQGIPQTVRMLGLPHPHGGLQGELAEECRIEITRGGNHTYTLEVADMKKIVGKDEDIASSVFTEHDLKKLALKSEIHEVPPETMEIGFTNFSAQRDVRAPWSIHYQWVWPLLDNAEDFQLDFSQGDPKKQLQDFTDLLLQNVFGDGAKQPLYHAFVEDLKYVGPSANAGLKAHPFPVVVTPLKMAAPFRTPQFRWLCPFVGAY